MLRALSLGWGVQSWTLAAMSALGVLPKLDVAIHADTRHERGETYAFAEEMMPWLEARGVRVATVRAGGRDGTDVVTSKGVVEIPAYTLRGGKWGQLRRQCTRRWKVRPIRALLQAERKGRRVELWLGITLDEWTRAKDADVKYIQHRFPLLELGMTRADCVAWLTGQGLPVPGKSACVFCPYHDQAGWRQRREEDGEDWRKAVAVAEEIREARLPGTLHLVRSDLLLDEAVGAWAGRPRQGDLWSMDDADAACGSGHCFL